MAIPAVSSATSAGTSAAASAVQQKRPQQAEARKPDPSVSIDESAKTREAQQKQAATPEQPKPAVNAQGQKIGQFISVRA